MAIHLLQDGIQASCLSRRGLVRLLRLRTRQQSAELLKQFIGQQRAWGLKLPPFLAGKDVAEAFVFAVYCQNFLLRDSIPRDRDAFEQRLISGKAGLFDAASQLTSVLDKVVAHHFELIRQLKLPAYQDSHVSADVGSQLAQLLADQFLYCVPFYWLREYPRYLQAIAYRLERARGQLERDNQLSAEIQNHWQKLLGLVQKDSGSLNAFVEDRDTLSQIRWMIEEFRVSLFAQQLRTRIPASAKRLDRLWESTVGGTG